MPHLRRAGVPPTARGDEVGAWLCNHSTAWCSIPCPWRASVHTHGYISRVNMAWYDELDAWHAAWMESIQWRRLPTLGGSSGVTELLSSGALCACACLGIGWPDAEGGRNLDWPWWCCASVFGLERCSRRLRWGVGMFRYGIARDAVPRMSVVMTLET